MKISVIVTCHNYRDYVADAVESVLSQSTPPHEVVVVDDGSTDDSVQLLTERYEHHPLVRILSTPNRGQLAAFCEGFRCTTGEVVSFLDADDIWEPEYIRCVSECFAARPSVDMVMTNLQYFGESTGTWNESPKDINHGITSCIVALSDQSRWIGSPTSCLSIRRAMLQRILSLPEDYYSDWKIQADDCLVIGGSILGAHKFSIGTALVRYRVHGKNNWASRKWEVVNAFRLQRAAQRMKWFYLSAAFGCSKPHAALVHLEFKSAGRRSMRELGRYCLFAVKSAGGFESKVKVILMLVKYWLKGIAGSVP